MPAAGSIAVLMRITDIFLALPKLILALAFVAALGPGIENAIIAIAIDLVAALCPHRPRRNADHPQFRLHRGGELHGRLADPRIVSATSCRCASPH
jgi:ABC-type phosphate/phosphonate transport system permease subunit